MKAISNKLNKVHNRFFNVSMLDIGDSIELNTKDIIILKQSEREFAKGEGIPAEEVFRELREEICY